MLQRHEIYLANHSLGRPLDQTVVDVRQALDQWYEDMNAAWDHWLAEISAYRQRIARLIRASRADCIVPKTSAGQGLRTVLNCFNHKIQVITTTSEFSSIDHIVKVYSQRDRIQLVCVDADDHDDYHMVKTLKKWIRSTSK